MQAIQIHKFGGPEVLRLEELEVPVPTAAEVLVKVIAAGVNPVDTYQRSGANPGLALPAILGLDAAGVVERVGADVRGVCQGDRVYVSGTRTGAYAQFLVSTPAQTFSLPSSTSFAEGAALGVPYATAYRALLQRAETKTGDLVLVHGASGCVGLAVLQFAKALGFRVVGTAGTIQGREVVLASGAIAALDHNSDTYINELLAFSHGRGFDVILEMLANVNLGKTLPLLAKRGRIVVIGSRGKAEILPRDLMTREADIRGMSLFNVPIEELGSIHAAVGRGLRDGSLRPKIAAEMPLLDAGKAHQQVLRPGVGGKLVLLPWA